MERRDDSQDEGNIDEISRKNGRNNGVGKTDRLKIKRMEVVGEDAKGGEGQIE